MVEAVSLAVGARDAARLVAISERAWRVLDAAGGVPRGFVLPGLRRKVWRVTDLERWAALGFPDRAEFEAIERAGVGT